MSLFANIKASGYAGAGGAIGSILSRQLAKIDKVKEYEYGIPIGVFVVGHMVAWKVNAVVGHSMCAVAGFQAAEMMQNKSAEKKNLAEGGEASGYYGQLPAGYYQQQYNGYGWPQYAAS